MNATGVPLPEGSRPLANIEFPLFEQLEIDGSGMVIRTVIKPRFTERFLAPQLEQMKDLLNSYQEKEVVLRLQSDHKSLVAPTFVDRDVSDFQIFSMDVDHIEILHFLEERIPPANKTIYTQNEYSIR
jgi:hypothetical protein